ncbi:MAG: hypothetical protein JNL34_05120 [Anaerolineae bacterium]|nr:hypothetical protein [Anaerolineae bacterium]
MLLLGGRDKKLPWNSMMKLALSKCRAIVAFGEAAGIIVKAAKKAHGTEKVTRVETLDEAVVAAKQAAQPGDVVLLSPGATSYDAYVDFAARGEHFRALINDL